VPWLRHLEMYQGVNFDFPFKYNGLWGSDQLFVNLEQHSYCTLDIVLGILLTNLSLSILYAKPNSPSCLTLYPHVVGCTTCLVPGIGS